MTDTSTMDRQDAINADGAKCDQIAASITATLKLLTDFGTGKSGHIEHDDVDAIRKALTKASDALDYAFEVLNEQGRGDAMTKHTPGPWEAAPFSSVVGCVVMAQPDRTKNSIRVAGVHGPQDRAEIEANARAIAAAPEGFASLLDLHGFAKARIGEMDADELAQFERATAALAKAGVS